jgi:pentatricopeptide repeat protein
LDAWAKSGEGEAAAERAEAILEWMDRLNKSGNGDVKPDTITFNAVIDAWARSGCKRGPQRAEQILNHMDELYHGGNIDVKPDTYTYNTLINALAKSGDGGSAARAEEILKIMEDKYSKGDTSYKPNTRSHTSVIDAWAKSGEPGAARRAEMILTNLRNLYEAEGDPDIKPNVYTANAVMNVSFASLFLEHFFAMAALMNVPSVFCRHVRLRSTRKIARRHSTWPFAFSSGSTRRQTSNPTHTPSPLCSPCAPTSSSRKINR